MNIQDLKRILDMEDINDDEFCELINQRFKKRMNASTAGKNPKIRHYRKIRTYHKQMQQKISDYFSLNEIDIRKGFMSDMQMLSEKHPMNLILDEEEQCDWNAIFDLMLYPYFPNCICERMLKNKKVRSEKNIAYFKMMMASQFSVYKIKNKDEENSVLTLENLMNNEVVEVMDEALTRSGIEAGCLIASRIFTWEDVSYLSGSMFLFKKNVSKVNKWLKKNKNHQIKAYQFLELFMIYKECIEEKQAFQISYQTV